MPSVAGQPHLGRNGGRQSCHVQDLPMALGDSVSSNCLDGERECCRVAGFRPQAWASSLFILPSWTWSLGEVTWLGHFANSEALKLGSNTLDSSLSLGI